MLDCTMQPIMVFNPALRAARNASKARITPPVFASFTLTP
jgi:hypothetical protein